MEEFFVGISAGVLVSLFNRFVLSGYLRKMCGHDDDDDGVSSQSSAISTDVHIHHT